MQMQNHVNIGKGGWPRCRDVSCRGGRIQCSLDLNRAYDLVQAYQHDIHLRFLECESDSQLVSFVRTWGPLTISVDEWPRKESSAPLAAYRAYQRRLKAVVKLLTSFKSSSEERESLLEFIRAESEDWLISPVTPTGSDPLLLVVLTGAFKIDGRIEGWIENATLTEVRSATTFILNSEVFGTGGACFNCERRRGRPEITARWSVNTLEDALKWMIWYDEFTSHPLVCCGACRKVFRADTAHVRRYCSYECGHRVAARDWQRRRRRASGRGDVSRKAR
jgi:hypothetical protein